MSEQSDDCLTALEEGASAGITVAGGQLVAQPITVSVGKSSVGVFECARALTAQVQRLRNREQRLNRKLNVARAISKRVAENISERIEQQNRLRRAQEQAADQSLLVHELVGEVTRSAAVSDRYCKEAIAGHQHQFSVIHRLNQVEAAHKLLVQDSAVHHIAFADSASLIRQLTARGIELGVRVAAADRKIGAQRLVIDKYHRPQHKASVDRAHNWAHNPINHNGNVSSVLGGEPCDQDRNDGAAAGKDSCVGQGSGSADGGR